MQQKTKNENNYTINFCYTNEQNDKENNEKKNHQNLLNHKWKRNYFYKFIRI